MKQVFSKINIKLKRIISIIIAIAFIFVVTFMVLHFIVDQDWILLVISIAFAAVLAYFLNYVYEFNKTYVLTEKSIQVFNRRKKMKHEYFLKDTLRVSIYKSFKEEFVIFEDKKKGQLIPISCLSEADKDFIKQIIKVNKFPHKDKKHILYK